MSLQSIELTGEQKSVLFLRPTNPILIKGVAGSGKTTLSIYRAKHLLESYSDLFQQASIIIFTYNKSLSQYMQILLQEVLGGYQENSDIRKPSSKGLNVQVSNFHKWSRRFLIENGKITASSIMQTGEPESALNQAIVHRRALSGARILEKSFEFFKDEVAWIKGKLIKTYAEYLETKRTGRGTQDRVAQKDKIDIWKVYEVYCAILRKKGKVDWNDHARLCLETIKEKKIQPMFSHIIVDEAQDLSKAQLLTIMSLLKPETNSITIIADVAQRIYKSGFTWKEVGINARGNTREFKKNYRNTKEIALAANSLISHNHEDEEITPMDIESIVKSGNKPVIVYYRNEEEATDTFIKKIEGIRKKGGSIAVLHRYRDRGKPLLKYKTILKNHGIKSEIINNFVSVDFRSNSVKLCTWSSIKGLEFDHIFIMGVAQSVIPKSLRDDIDEYDIDDERKLLYTVMTRARQSLFIFSPKSDPSEFLKQIDPQYVTVEE